MNELFTHFAWILIGLGFGLLIGAFSMLPDKHEENERRKGVRFKRVA